MKGFLEILIGPGSFDMMFHLGGVVLQVVALILLVMLCVAYSTWLERKVIGHMQVRMGPMRVGWHGLLQPIADGVKLFFKEDLIPSQADKPVFYLAPLIALLAALSSLAVLPLWQGFMIANINVSLLYVFALSSMGAYGVVMSGWASNSKYSFLGGLRSSAQVVSYEIALGMSLIPVMMMAETMNLNDIIEAKIFLKPYFLPPLAIGSFIFFLSALAETNRTPFDLPEAESELVAGYFTEYSGFRFSLFFMAEYAAMIMMAGVGATCFIGGWWGPGVESMPFLGPVYLAAKIFIFMFVYIWVRATFPRYRYDQLMSLGWKVLIPLALFNIVMTAVIKMMV